MAANRYRVHGLESDATGTTGMWYQDASGIWKLVSGSFATGQIPKGTATPDVAWSADATGGGGGSDNFFGAYGPKTPPPGSGWTWFNQRGSTVTTSSRDSSILLSVPLGNAGASTVLTGYMRTAPSTPYTIIANMEGPILATNYTNYGLCFGNAGSEIRFLYYGYVDGRIDLYVGPTSGGAAGTATFGPLTLRNQLTFFAIRDDGTNKKYYYHTDEEGFVEFFSEARTAQFTPTEVGFFAGPRQNSYGQRVRLWSWKSQSGAP